MSPSEITAAATVVEEFLILLGVWLHDRTRARREEAHQRFVINVLQALSRDGQVCDERSEDALCALEIASVLDEHGARDA